MSTAIDDAGGREVAILARLLGNGDRRLPSHLARYVLHLGFSDADKARMHDLVVRNREDALSPEEKQEMLAYDKAGTILSILKSKSRRALGVRPKKRNPS